LSYAGELCLGLNIDCAVLEEADGADKLIRLWEEELVRMAQELTKENI